MHNAGNVLRRVAADNPIADCGEFLTANLIGPASAEDIQPILAADRVEEPRTMVLNRLATDRLIDSTLGHLSRPARSENQRQAGSDG
jgi:hypothetical protein